MNHQQYRPGFGNQHANGQGNERASSHRQGQNGPNPHYNGLHGGFQYSDDMTPPHTHSSRSAHTQSLLPAVVPQSSNQLTEANSGQPSKGFNLGKLGSLPNLTEIKGFVDRMGGIDGILTTVTKVQKVMGTVSQMAPMVKVLMGSFGKKSISDSDENNEWKPRRRRRRRPNGSTRPKYKSPRRRRRPASRPRRRR